MLRGLPVTKRRVEYIRDKISGGSGGGPRGPNDGEGRRKTPRVVATSDEGDVEDYDDEPATSVRTPSASVKKKVSRGAIHGSRDVGGSGQGKAKLAGAAAVAASEGGLNEDGEELEAEAGGDFMAELRDRFAVGADELASDDDLAVLADDALFSPQAVPEEVGESDGTSDEKARGWAVAGEEGSRGRGEVTGAASGVEMLPVEVEQEAGEGETYPATAAANERDGGEPTQETVQLLEDIKAMKVRARYFGIVFGPNL